MPRFLVVGNTIDKNTNTINKTIIPKFSDMGNTITNIDTRVSNNTTRPIKQ